MSAEYANLFAALKTNAKNADASAMDNAVFGLEDKTKLQFIYTNELSQLKDSKVLVGIKTPLIKN